MGPIMSAKTAKETLAAFQDMEASLDDTDLGLASLKVTSQLHQEALGRIDEALDSGKKALEVKEMTLEMDRMELGEEYRNLANAFLHVSTFKEVLPLGLKALEIHEELGDDSVEVAHDRMLLGAIYSSAGEYGCMGRHWTSLSSRKISLRKFDEAINTLKGIVQRTKNKKYSENQACMFFLIGEALCDQGKFADSKGCLDFILKESIGFNREGATRAAWRGNSSARIGLMLLLRGDVPQVIPYLESAVERFKKTFPCKDFVVDYNNLGVAYLESEKPHSVVQMFAVEKDNLVVSLGPYHPDSIVACLNLPIACGAMGR
ncbi:hypothetical protein PTKIN_Ptkin10aG0198100 [Pterospermum kingtungense]